MNETDLRMTAVRIRYDLERICLPTHRPYGQEDITVFMTKELADKFIKQTRVLVVGFRPDGEMTIFGQPVKLVGVPGLRWWIGIEGGNV